jgi:type IV secretory pathway protease TraF
MGSSSSGGRSGWLFGFNDAHSWDARYFGPVPLANLRGVLTPVVTW